MSKNGDDHELFAGAFGLNDSAFAPIEPMHRYALVKNIKEVSDDRLKFEQESLYPPFDAAQEGLVDSEGAISATNRRIRNYRPSEDAIKHLEKARSSFKKTLAGISRVVAVQ